VNRTKSTVRGRAGLIALLTGLAGLLVAGPGAGPAAASAEGQLNGAVPRHGFLDIAFSAKDGAKALQIDPGSVQVFVQPNGGGARKLALANVSETSARLKRSTMLLLDVSDSMVSNGYFGAAKAAAKQFLKVVPADVSVGLVTFGDPAQQVMAPTMDRQRLAQAIEGLKTNGNTAMYQAVKIGVASMGNVPLRSLVMLTDGKNDDLLGQKFTAQDAQQAIKPKGRRTSAVEFRGILVGKESQDAISQIAGTDRVSVLMKTADLGTSLRSLFNDTAEGLKQQAQVTAKVPADLAGQEVTVRVQATVGGQPVFASSTQTLAKAPVRVPVGRLLPVTAPDRGPIAVSTPVAVGALFALFGGLAMLVFTATGALAGSKEQESEVIRRLAVYSVSGTRAPQQISVTEQTTTFGDSALARSAVSVMSRVARTSQLERSLDGRLEAAGLPLRTAEWMLLHIGAAVGTSLLLLVASRGQFAAMVVGLLLGLVVPWLVLNFRKSRRENQFLAQLPDTLQLLAGSLAAGYSLPQAMDSVVRESHPPISMEFNRALIEARLGLLPEDALDGIATRTGSQDFSWIVMAIRIQRDVGGNLAELLSTVADTLRERERLRRQVNSLSAEGRLSGLILGALPVVFALYLILVRPEYIAPLFNTAIGILLLSVGVITLLVGAVWMAKVIKVEV
jgi:tight adherence protein B